jgi:hypothetical protein
VTTEIESLTREQLEYIFVEILSDKGGHGNFLKAFGRAFMAADHENQALLTPVALQLINKYDLTKHLPGHAE